MLHAEDDSLCTAEFPAGCLGGGMMGPDSIYCEFEIAPSDSAPHNCVVVVHCEVFDEDGGGMMSDHMTPRGLFQREVHLTFHYDREYVMGLGIDPGNLVITTWVGDTFTIVEEATHDLVAGVFRFSSSNLTSWYGIADRAELPVAVQEATWGRIKDNYR